MKLCFVLTPTSRRTSLCGFEAAHRRPDSIPLYPSGSPPTPCDTRNVVVESVIEEEAVLEGVLELLVEEDGEAVTRL